LFLSPVNSILYPIIWLLGEILATPFRLVIGLSSFVVELFVDIVSVLRESWSTLSALYQVGSVPRSPVLTSDNSIWGSLWKDLLYQVSEVRWHSRSIHQTIYETYFDFFSFRFSVHYGAFCMVLLPSFQHVIGTGSGIFFSSDTYAMLQFSKF
jgi:hypothetical protein